MRERLIERLAAGETVHGYRESGNSMTPIIVHRQPVDLAPVVDFDALRKGDIVFCRVQGSFYLHLVNATAEGRVQIASNKGRVNGWAAPHSVYGIVVAIDGTPRRNSQYPTVAV